MFCSNKNGRLWWAVPLGEASVAGGLEVICMIVWLKKLPASSSATGRTPGRTQTRCEPLAHQLAFFGPKSGREGDENYNDMN
jgi:hypothetical protein